MWKEKKATFESEFLRFKYLQKMVIGYKKVSISAELLK